MVSPIQVPEMAIDYLVGGIPTTLQNMKVNWGYYSQYMESQKIHVPNHQPVYSDGQSLRTYFGTKTSEYSAVSDVLSDEFSTF